LLILARLPGGACIGLIFIDLSHELEAEIQQLESFEGSKVCKYVQIDQKYDVSLQKALATLIGKRHKGCRLDIYGNTLPFTGTQVCGYTLEHALGIKPNANKDGDLNGVELKTHTQEKVTLFTPEPDFGAYAEDFQKFMVTYGYQSGDEWRLTGIHRANIKAKKSGLTLKVREYRTVKTADDKTDWERDENGQKIAYPYNPDTPLTPKMEGVEVVLVDDNDNVAAGWSLQRLMNNWGAKHNETVYITAQKVANTIAEEVGLGYTFEVSFGSKVIWCKETSAERLLKAINDGVIFLDPAPKLVPTDSSKNKRRAQWRVNDITKAVHALYEKVEVRDLAA
jgi:hypothetical protein